MFLVQVWIEYAAVSLDRPFTYACNDEHVARGKRVEVQFSGRNSVGFVESVEYFKGTKQEAEDKLGFHLEEIVRVIDDEPLLNEELFEMAKWMQKETISSRISCFQAMLPAKLKPSGNRTAAVMQTWVKIKKEEPGVLTPRQQEVYNGLKEKGRMPLSQWREWAKTVGKTLEEKGIVERFEIEKEYVENAIKSISPALTLTSLQKEAMKSIVEAKQTTILLHGVTGSGKTEVYLQLAQRVIDEGKQVLILVPEISLTPQMVKRVESRFLNRVAIYHSALNNQEKYEQFKRVKKQLCDIVVGTRSAVFMPFEKLGLIILDEEHDSSYKQDSTPQYHCRDAAIWRANYHHCKVVLGSATPSLDSYARTLKNVYKLVEMPSRINDKLPVITTVSTQEAMRKGESYVLTDTLKNKIQDRLERNEQVMLMLNRRGYSPTVRCTHCGESVKCPHCDLSLTWHRDDGLLKCHTCGYVQPMIHQCTHCGSEQFSMFGFGTQRLVEEVKKAFPFAKVDRMDADTTMAKNAHKKILDRLENHETDILIGTQIIAKGIDYPDVTLVGIINGDAGLNRSDFRSVESNFQLIVQAAGRSGRAQKSGEVVIQAFDPKHYAIQYGSRQDYRGFFKKEMNFRHLTNNPPYSYLISIVFNNRDKQKAVDEIHQFAILLKQKEAGKVLGPSELYKMQDMYRFRLILKGKNREEMINAVAQCQSECLALKMRSRIKIDTSPMMLD